MNSSLLGPIFVTALGGLVALTLMVIHPIGPALFIAVVSPFDALFAGVFGVAGNAVTFLPFLVLVARVPMSLLPTYFLGTRIQVALAVFIAALSISHIAVVDTLGQMALLEYARKITVFLLVGLIAWGMREPSYVDKINKTLVVSMSIFVVLSLADYYLGIRILPGSAETYGGVVGLSLDDVGVHSLRFNGGGLSINQTANMMLTPIFLSLGWYLQKERRGRTLALGCLAICVAGLAATISRSGLLGLVAGGLLLAPTAARLGLSQLFLIVIAGVLVLVGGVLLFEQAGVIDAFVFRFLPDTEGGQADGTGRMLVFGNAFRLFLTSPIAGIGDSMTSIHPDGIGFGAHNSFLGLLAEAGIIGAFPFVVLVLLVILQLSRKIDPSVDPVYAHWRPFFLASYVACQTQSSFNEYTWERLTWYVVAFAVATELRSLTRQRKAASDRSAELEGEGSWLGDQQGGMRRDGLSPSDLVRYPKTSPP